MLRAALALTLLILGPGLASATHDSSQEPVIAARIGPVTVTLYAHLNEVLLFGGYLTPDPPNETHEPDRSHAVRNTMPAATTIDDCRPDLPCPGNSSVRLDLMRDRVWFAEAGWPRTHGTPWMDTPLGDDPWVFYWYLSSDATRTSPSSTVGVQPLTQVRVVLVERGGAGIVAEAESEAVNLLTLPTGGQAQEFRIELDGPDAIRRNTSLHLEVFVEQVRSDELGASATQNHWCVHTGPIFQPRLEIPVLEPLVDRGLTWDRHQGKVYVRSSIYPAFGGWDVARDAGDLRLLSEGTPTNGRELFEHLVTKLPYDGHQANLTVNTTWSIEEKMLSDGPKLEFEVVTRTRAGTFEVVQTALFQPTLEEAQDVPLPWNIGVVALVAVAVALSIGRHRRRR